MRARRHPGFARRPRAAPPPLHPSSLTVYQTQHQRRQACRGSQHRRCSGQGSCKSSSAARVPGERRRTLTVEEARAHSDERHPPGGSKAGHLRRAHRQEGGTAAVLQRRRLQGAVHVPPPTAPAGLGCELAPTTHPPTWLRMTSEAEKMRVSFQVWLKQLPGAMPLIWQASLAMVFRASEPVMVSVGRGGQHGREEGRARTRTGPPARSGRRVAAERAGGGLGEPARRRGPLTRDGD